MRGECESPVDNGKPQENPVCLGNPQYYETITEDRHGGSKLGLGPVGQGQIRKGFISPIESSNISL